MLLSPQLSLKYIDCMEYMKTIPDKQYTFAIVDPNYGIQADKKKAHSNIRDNDKWSDKDWDSASPPPEYFKELFRISQYQIIWGGNYFIENLKNTPCFLVWDKMNGEGFSMADAELAWTNLETSVRIVRIARASIGKKIHPTQKPVKLYDWTIKQYVKKGDSIIDTHGGSMSIAISVLKANMFADMELTLTVCENDKEHYDDGYNRVLEYQNSMIPFPATQPKLEQQNLFADSENN